jgi:hypothetical protein
MQRPVGVTILAVIVIIYGIFNLLLAVLGLLGQVLKASGTVPINYDVGTLAYATISDAILGILYLVFGIGAFSLKGWAWTVGVVVLMLDIVRRIVGDVISGTFGAFSIISIVIALLLLVYLFRPNVRAAFGMTT